MGHGLGNAGLHGRDELARDDPASDLVGELVARSGGQGFDADRRDAELAVPPALLLVLPLGRRGRRDGLPVGHPHLGRVDFHVELALQAGHHVAQVGLSEPPEQRLVGLVVPGDGQYRVLVDQAVQGVGQLVLVVATPCRDGHRQDRGREPDGRSGRSSGRRQGVAGARTRQLGHRTDVPGRQRVDVDGHPTLEAHHVAEPFVITRPPVGQVEVPLDSAGKYPEVRHMSQVGIDGRLEHMDKGVGRRIGRHVDRGCADDDWHRRPVRRCRAHLHDVVAQPVHGDGDGRRATDHREHRATGHATTQYLLQLLERRHLPFQEPLQ